jgi:hypothetical protein
MSIINGWESSTEPMSGTVYPIPSGFLTTKLLDDSDEFKSNIIDLINHTQVQTEVLASHDGLLTFIFYSDSAGLNPIRTLNVSYVSAHGFQVLSTPTFGYFTRYKFTNNSGSNQTSFYYATKISKTSISAQILSLTESVNDNMTSSLIRVGNDYSLDLARGLIITKSIVHKFGSNHSVGTNEEFISAGGVLGLPNSASTVTVVSDSVEDDIGGLGARTVLITGLDDSFNEITETLECGGTSISTPTTSLFWRIYRVKVITCGTYQSSNIGTLTFAYTGNGNALAINPLAGSSETTHFVIPSGKTGYLSNLYTNVDSKKKADISVWVQDDFNINVAPFKGRRLINKVIGLAGSNEVLLGSYIKIPTMSEIYITAIATAADTSINAHYDLVLIDN